MATNLSKYKMKKFNYIDTPNVKVIDAIRMSISIPFVFTATVFENDTFVDGGLIENYPITGFKEEIKMGRVLGVKLINHGELDSHIIDEKIDDIESYIMNIISCYMVQKEKHTTINYKECTIYIDTEQITHATNFALTPQEKNKLIEIGYNSTVNFLELN